MSNLKTRFHFEESLRLQNIDKNPLIDIELIALDVSGTTDSEIIAEAILDKYLKNIKSDVSSIRFKADIGFNDSLCSPNMTEISVEQKDCSSKDYHVKTKRGITVSFSMISDSLGVTAYSLVTTTYSPSKLFKQ